MVPIMWNFPSKPWFLRVFLVLGGWDYKKVTSFLIHKKLKTWPRWHDEKGMEIGLGNQHESTLNGSLWGCWTTKICVYIWARKSRSIRNPRIPKIPGVPATFLTKSEANSARLQKWLRWVNPLLAWSALPSVSRLIRPSDNSKFLPVVGVAIVLAATSQWAYFQWWFFWSWGNHRAQVVFGLYSTELQIYQLWAPGTPSVKLLC